MQEQKIQELLQALFKLKYNWETDNSSYTSDVINDKGRANVENVIRSFLLDNRDSELGQLQAKVNFYEEMIKKSTFAPLLNIETSDESDKCNLQCVSFSLQREQLAKDILLALLQNPERYKYIAEQVESGNLKQEDANFKNINKAYKIADSFLRVGANER